ncbi:MAG: hypothetical protein AB1453_12275 [Chloroflexota bacterium]|jgi:hypothetical protein
MKASCFRWLTLVIALVAMVGCMQSPQATPTISSPTITAIEPDLTGSPLPARTTSDVKSSPSPEKIATTPRPPAGSPAARKPTLPPACTSHKQIIAVSELPQQADGSYKDWRRFVHPEYRYSLFIPPDWGACYVGEHHVSFFPTTNPYLVLSVGCKFAGDDTHILRTGVAAGDAFHEGQVLFAGQTIRKTIIRYEGRDKIVLYGYKEDKPYQIEAGSMVFTISLDDHHPQYEEADLSAEIQALADTIVAGIVLTSSSP